MVVTAGFCTIWATIHFMLPSEAKPINTNASLAHATRQAPIANPVVFPTLPSEPAAHHRGIDVLKALVTAGSLPYAAPVAGQSRSSTEALHRALASPSFSALASRTDAEGLFEASVWIHACHSGELHAGDARCDPAQLPELAYSDRLQLAAIAAGQPAAVLFWIEHHAASQWMQTVLPGGGMLREHIFAMAAHGDSEAFRAIYLLCDEPDACVNAAFTQRVMKALWMQARQQAVPGNTAESAQVANRVTELRQRLPTWDLAS
jgi:hypothetical protein